MNWSPSLIATGIWIVISSFLGLLELLLRYRWKDGRTQKYKIARKYLFVLFILSSIFALALTMYDKTRAEQESLRLAKALREAADDRKKHATAGRIETLTGLSQAFVIGDSGTAFISFRSASLFDALPFPPMIQKIAKQNSVIIGNTLDGKLSVSARICGRDGLIAEINDNEWKVNPSKSWDRNYSSNAFEVQNADGEIVFQVKIEKDSNFGGLGVAHFQGIFFDSDGNGIGFTEVGKAKGAFFSFLPANSGRPLPQIKPLFKYPSELHLGDLSE